MKWLWLNDLPDPFTQDELNAAILHETGRVGVHHANTECPFCGDGDLFIKISGRKKQRHIFQMGCNSCTYQHAQPKPPKHKNAAEAFAAFKKDPSFTTFIRQRHKEERQRRMQK